MMSNQLIRIRIETLLRERGKKWSEVYNNLQWHKSFASAILNGKLIPPLWQRVALAKELNCDTSVIWTEDDLALYKQQQISLEAEKQNPKPSPEPEPYSPNDKPEPYQEPSP